MTNVCVLRRKLVCFVDADTVLSSTKVSGQVVASKPLRIGTFDKVSFLSLKVVIFLI